MNAWWITDLNELLDLRQEIASTVAERHCSALTHAAPMYAGASLSRWRLWW